MTLQLALAHLRFQLKRQGWLTTGGLLLLVLAAFIEVAEVASIRQQATDLRTKISLRQQGRPHPQEDVSAQRLARFYSELPPVSSAHEAIRMIHRSASANHVKLANGDYRISPLANSGLVRYQFVLPARASYPQLRKWLADVMNTLPNAAIDDFSLRRDETGIEGAEANVRMTLFLKET
jgi:hypothetical protein